MNRFRRSRVTDPKIWLALFCAFVSCKSLAQEEIVILFVEDEATTDERFWYGASLGVAEANVQGQFLGLSYRLERRSAEVPENADDDVAIAMIAAVSSENLTALAQWYAPRGHPVLNVSLSTDALRTACLDGVFHILPSDRMRADAIGQWQSANPGAAVDAVAWHPDFIRYAARDLNGRFRERFGVPMNSESWAGWAAARMLAEAAVRARSREPSAIAAYLRDELAFDGQKGVAHSFRDTGQLRQPLLIVAQGQLIGEAPVRGVADFTELDSLGLARCP